MREIKFRAWDEDNKVMLNEIERSDIHIDSSGYLIKHCRLIIMQYTGLKDKNGKEIYEGDIFDCPYSDETDNHHKWQIIWGEVTGGFVLQRIGSPCNQRQVHQTVSDMTRRQILGNIYENPNLIK